MILLPRIQLVWNCKVVDVFRGMSQSLWKCWLTTATWPCPLVVLPWLIASCPTLCLAWNAVGRHIFSFCFHLHLYHLQHIFIWHFFTAPYVVFVMAFTMVVSFLALVSLAFPCNVVYFAVAAIMKLFIGSSKHFSLLSCKSWRLFIQAWFCFLFPSQNHELVCQPILLHWWMIFSHCRQTQLETCRANMLLEVGCRTPQFHSDFVFKIFSFEREITSIVLGTVSCKYPFWDP